MIQRLWGGIRFLDGAGPSMRNVALLDAAPVPMVNFMKRIGMQVDLNHFAKMEKELARGMEELTEEVHSLTGYRVNLDSGDQVAELLFKKLKLKQAREKLTDSGDRESVEDAVLTAIQHDHPCISKIQDFKELSKLLGTYVRPMPKLAQRTKFGEWRMFPNLKHTRVPTGRFACSEPNLLAMPTRTDIGREIRNGFITYDGWVLVSVDESQIEPRAAAQRSKDPNLMKVYHNEEDIYSDFSIAAFKLLDNRFRDAEGWHYPSVDKDKHRRPSKTCVLASIYEVTSKGLLEQMPIVCRNCSWISGSKDKNKKPIPHLCPKFVSFWNENNCQDLINAFYIKYEFLLNMRKRDHARCFKYGYLWDDWGRLLHTTAVHSVLSWVVSAALREAGNMPLQATACGTLKITMGQFFEDLEQGDLLDVCHPLLPVHDEIVMECKESEADEMQALLAARFENCVRWDVDIKASGAKAATWGRLPK
jgi:DNA polymerase-1